MMKKRMMAGLVLLAATTTTVAAYTAPVPAADDSITVYFVRHGQTLLNSTEQVQGWVDSPLTQQGITMARDVGEGLKKIKFDSFYSSDAGRQRETLRVILQQEGVKNYQPRELKGLREVYFGCFEGYPNSEMIAGAAKSLGLKDGAELWRHIKAGALTTDKQIDAISKADRCGKAETFQQVKARTSEALKTMIDQAEAQGDKTVLAVSSGLAIQTIMAGLTDNPARNKPLENAAVVKVVYHDGQYSVPEIGNMQYLKDGKAALEKEGKTAGAPRS
nr:histidine phosphatase family protein [Erwinia sorbitola]